MRASMEFWIVVLGLIGLVLGIFVGEFVEILLLCGIVLGALIGAWTDRSDHAATGL